MTARRLVQALGGHWHGSYGTARCPAHDDREPSLSIRDGDGGEPVFNCFAGCDWRDIKDVLRADGLLPERGPGHAPERRRRPPRAGARAHTPRAQTTSTSSSAWSSRAGSAKAATLRT